MTAATALIRSVHVLGVDQVYSEFDHSIAWYQGWKVARLSTLSGNLVAMVALDFQVSRRVRRGSHSRFPSKVRSLQVRYLNKWSPTKSPEGTPLHLFPGRCCVSKLPRGKIKSFQMDRAVANIRGCLPFCFPIRNGVTDSLFQKLP